MSITVLCELNVRPGQDQSIIQVATDQISLPPSRAAGRRFARLFQHVHDPTRLLYVAEWNSREEFEAYRQASPMPGRPDQHARLPDCRYYQRLASFERVLVPVQIVDATFVDGLPETHTARRDLSLAYHRASTHGRDGRSIFEIYESVDAPPGLLILGGWESAAAHAQADRATDHATQQGDLPAADRALIEQLVRAGGRARRFVGHARAETPGR